MLRLLIGARREHNFFYQILHLVSRPFVVAARWLTPRFVLQQHLPLVACLLLGLVWFAVTVAKVSYCLRVGVAVCQ